MERTRSLGGRNTERMKISQERGETRKKLNQESRGEWKKACDNGSFPGGQVVTDSGSDHKILKAKGGGWMVSLYSNLTWFLNIYQCMFQSGNLAPSVLAVQNLPREQAPILETVCVVEYLH